MCWSAGASYGLFFFFLFIRNQIRPPTRAIAAAAPIPIPAPAPADRPFDSPSPAGAAVFVEVEVVPVAVADVVVEPVEPVASEAEDWVTDALAVDDEDDMLVAARSALLSTVHHVGDALADAPVALEGAFTSPFSGSTKKCFVSSSQQLASTAPQQYMFLPQSTRRVPVALTSARTSLDTPTPATTRWGGTYQRTWSSNRPNSTQRNTGAWAYPRRSCTGGSFRTCRPGSSTCSSHCRTTPSRSPCRSRLSSSPARLCHPSATATYAEQQTIRTITRVAVGVDCASPKADQQAGYQSTPHAVSASMTLFSDSGFTKRRTHYELAGRKKKERTPSNNREQEGIFTCGDLAVRRTTK